MPLSDSIKQRSAEAANALKQLREDYRDVLVVLDAVTIVDISKHAVDSDEHDDISYDLDEDELRAILWHLGKHVGSNQTSQDLLPSIVRFAMDEHERKHGA
jgi:hypothetical protein